MRDARRARRGPGEGERNAHAWSARLFALFLVLFGLVPLANLVSALTPETWWNAAAAHWAMLTVVTLTFAYAFAWVLGDRLDRAWDALERAVLEPSPRSFGLTCALLAFALAAATSWFAFARRWVSVDEAIAIWHGRLILAGHLWVPADPDPVFFAGFDIPAAGGRWYSPVPIGGPALMALGDLLHAQWLIGPALTGVTVFAFYRFAARAFGEATARGATLVLTYAGSIELMGATRMTHVPALALIMLALAALARWSAAGDRGTAFAGAVAIGACLGATVAFRPYDAAIAAAVIGAFQLAALRGPAWRARSLAVQVLAGAIPVAIVLAANHAMTGSALRFGYEALNGPEHDPGFHVSPYGFEHSPLRGVMLASSYLMRLNESLLYWPIPAILVIVAGLFAMRRVTRWDVLTFAMIAAFVGAYGAYWFDGDMFGPRFLYPVVPLFVLLAARAPSLVAAHLRGTARRAMLLVIPLCLCYSWLVPDARFGFLRRVLQQRTFAPSGRIDIERLIASVPAKPALLFAPTGWRDRLLARLLALGVPQGEAIQLHDFADACDLQHAIEREERMVSDPAARLPRLVAATRADAPAPLRPELGTDGSIRLRDVAGLSPDCAREIAADSVGYINFAALLPYDAVDADGHLAGAVILARDLGDARNEALRARFGGRSWYRVRRSPHDPMAAYVVPYAGNALPVRGTGSANSP